MRHSLDDLIMRICSDNVGLLLVNRLYTAASEKTVVDLVTDFDVHGTHLPKKP